MNIKRFKYRHLLPMVLLSGATAIVAIADETGAAPVGIDQELDQYVADSLARLDSIEKAHAQMLAGNASAKYKNLKVTQYEGIAESDLYPMVAETHSEVVTALDTHRLEEADRVRLRGMLLDLDPLLINGAVYYSGAGDKDNMNLMARACVDTRMRGDMSNMPFSKSAGALYPSIVYCAASSAYNAADYNKAIDYFEEYMKTGATDQREQIALFLGQACIINKCPQRGVNYLVDAANEYSTNYNLLMITLQNCLDAGQTAPMGPLLERALLIKPDDEQLLNVRAALYENEGNYAMALDMYQRLYELYPSSLPVNKHIALCYYNLGSDYYNAAMMEADEKVAKRKLRQSKAYFQSASSKLEAVVDNSPSDSKYLKALAMTYGCLGETMKLQEVNVRLQALGVDPVTVTGMPESVTFDDSVATASSAAAVPDFQDFARGYVESNLAQWSKRREFEKTEDFEKRVSEDNIYQEYIRLCRQAEDDYLKKYASRLRISDLSLEPYDIDNQSYLVNSGMGPMVVKVPLKNKEAEAFKAGWSAMKFRNPQYFIKDNQVAVKSVDFVTPAGKTYSYSADNAAEYDFTEVNVDVASFIAQGNSKRHGNSKGRSTTIPSPAVVIRAKSDVDVNIPVTSRQQEKTIAVVWANENYKNVSHVAGALNDGETFAEYCKKTLGIPASNVFVQQDATYAEMLGAISRLKKFVAALGGGVDVIFYYAGHGVPDEATKDAYLLPVDGDGLSTVTAYPMKKLYADLTDTRAENVMVFMDACFSGAARDGGMIAEARGVALKPRQAAPEGNMFVLTAATDQETAMPYKEKNHGLFTYFLLKKLQDAKGNVTLKDLSDYVIEQVRKNSITINQKVQTPTVKVSGKLSTDWTKKKLKE